MRDMTKIWAILQGENNVIEKKKYVYEVNR